eukprot:746584-Hanusia_phi.AAC.2
MERGRRQREEEYPGLDIQKVLRLAPPSRALPKGRQQRLSQHRKVYIPVDVTLYSQCFAAFCTYRKTNKHQN